MSVPDWKFQFLTFFPERHKSGNELHQIRFATLQQVSDWWWRFAEMAAFSCWLGSRNFALLDARDA